MSPTSRALFFSLFGLFFLSCSSSHVSNHDVDGIDPSVQEVVIKPREQVEARGKKWMVSTQGKYATLAADEVMSKGGNVIDAAIAASLVIGVERPQSTGIGGGGFLIYHEAKTNQNFVIDFRERAPARANPKMFLDAKGNVITDLSVTGGASVGVPGLVAGLQYLHHRWSKKKWSDLVQPSVKLAHDGFPIYPELEHALQSDKDSLALFRDSKKIFLHPDGTAPKVGENLVQIDLSKTLAILAKNPKSFYQGAMARRIVASVKKHSGILTLSDLKKYHVIQRPTLEADWNGYRIVSMSPPSSGVIHVIQILKLIEHDPLERYGFLSGKTEHLLASAMQQAFADRAKYLGDPDFVKVPVKGLLDESYLTGLRRHFDEEKARFGDQVFPGNPSPPEPNETSHISIMDSEGNAVVTTQSINGWFGSAVVAEGTGILMNDTMDDFSAKPGVQNMFGATSVSDANNVQAHKTPLSSMSPTLVFKNGKPVMAIGAPGGTRIITGVAQTILNYFVFKKDLYDSVAALRIHEQWSPDVLSIVNRKLPKGVLEDLEARGWKTKRMPTSNRIMAVVREGNNLIGVADPRDIGTSKGR